MLSASQQRRTPRCPTADIMTFRVYVRWPGQRVSDKTTTDSRAVADVAFNELAAKAESLSKQGALGVSFTDNGKQIDYRRFADDAAS